MRMRKLTNEELIKVANYDPGGCLCGHFESCSVCTRSDRTREFEVLASWAALELLARRGVQVREIPPTYIYESTRYEIVTGSESKH